MSQSFEVVSLFLLFINNMYAQLHTYASLGSYKLSNMLDKDSEKFSLFFVAYSLFTRRLQCLLIQVPNIAIVLVHFSHSSCSIVYPFSNENCRQFCILAHSKPIQYIQIGLTQNSLQTNTIYCCIILCKSRSSTHFIPGRYGKRASQILFIGKAHMRHDRTRM